MFIPNAGGSLPFPCAAALMQNTSHQNFGKSMAGSVDLTLLPMGTYLSGYLVLLINFYLRFTNLELKKIQI